MPNPTQMPAHELVYKRLREQILFGEMAPGQAVTIQGLTTSLGAGMTPVREAIRRLISDGALVFQGNRRVSVPKLTRDEAEQLVFLRKTIEKDLAWRATTRVQKEAIDRLAEIDSMLDRAILAGDVPSYLRGNYQFHSVLYGYAKAPILADVVDRLWLRFGPSMRVVCGRLGTQNLPDRHKDIIAALRNADADAAANALEQDVEQGVGQVIAVLDEKV